MSDKHDRANKLQAYLFYAEKNPLSDDQKDLVLAINEMMNDKDALLASVIVDMENKRVKAVREAVANTWEDAGNSVQMIVAESDDYGITTKEVFEKGEYFLRKAKEARGER